MTMFNFLSNLKNRYASPWQLQSFGIMGMNQRNVNFISRFNQRKLFPLVDNKLKTKKIAIEHKVKTPNLIGVVGNQHDVNNILQILNGSKAFCIKPSRGSGGKGILVITNAEHDHFVKGSGQVMSIHDVQRHLSNILAGLFSLGGKPDIALIEDLIHFDHVFDGYSYEGVPDTRVIVFEGFPIMSMMRLSTKASDGKANLHQGAVGVGICIRTGKAVRGVQHNEPIKYHPDTDKDLATLQVPHWTEVLTLASSCYNMSGLGYIGTDIVLDERFGPMLLELNARPGLAIQTANNAGLLPRLKLILALPNRHSMSVAQKVQFSKQHFGVFNS